MDLAPTLKIASRAFDGGQKPLTIAEMDTPLTDGAKKQTRQRWQFRYNRARRLTANRAFAAVNGPNRQEKPCAGMIG